MNILKKFSIITATILVSTTIFAENSQPYTLPAKTDMAKKTSVQKEVVVGPLKLHSSTEAYMDIYNHNNVDDLVIAATTPVAKKVQLHKFVGKDMVQIPNIDVKKHSEFSLKQGGYHVMLIDLIKALKPGMVEPITLIFQDGSWITVQAKVE